MTAMAKRRWRISTPTMLVLPAVALVLGLCAVPVLRVLALGFTDPRPGFQNYALLGSSETLLRIIGTTALMSVASPPPAAKSPSSVIRLRGMDEACCA